MTDKIENKLKSMLEKPIYSNDKYSVYESGVIEKHLIGFTTQDAIVDMATKLQAYIKDRFCKGGCAIYQFDKINKLEHDLKVANKIIDLILAGQCIRRGISDSTELYKQYEQQALAQLNGGNDGR